VSGDAVANIFRRDRALVSSALALLTVLSWVQMMRMPGDGTVAIMPCCGASYWMAFTMWVVMMAGMMIPSVAPMVLTHAAIVRRRGAIGGVTPLALSGLFLGGYLVAWTAFSAGAALAQWALYKSALLDGRSLTIGPLAGAVVLVAAGAFQLSPAKGACLKQCRAPVGYFTTEWREGPIGATRMGLRHGVFCIGCCWLLMAVLFALGIMNVVWGAVITAFVLAEKVLPWRRAVVWSGALACFCGAALLLFRAMIPS
jgi:predicted metal-binding membrane protein